MKIVAILSTFVALVAVALSSCSLKQKRAISDEDVRNHADSVVFAILDNRDMPLMLAAIDSLERLGELSKSRTIFFRTIAYNLLGKYRTSMKYYYQLGDIDVKSLTDQGDFEAYVCSYNNYLRVLCDMKRYDMALREAYTADKKLKSIGFGEFTDHHDVAQIIGECQLYLGQNDSAMHSFDKSLQAINRRLEKFKDPIDYRECQHTMRAIAMAFIDRGRCVEAQPWIERQVTLRDEARQRPNRDTVYVDEMEADINYCKALLMYNMGDRDHAESAYQAYLSTHTAQSLVNMVNSTEYLMLTRRYEEAAHNYSQLDQFFDESGYEADLENIGRYLFPKYRAHLLAGHRDSALTVATKIAEAYDSALIRQKANDAALVTTIYDTKGKERQIVEKEAELSQQRLGYSAIVLMILVGVFLEYTIHRRKAYNKLNAINRELTQANQRTEEVSQMKSKFIKEIFHEVRTPLNALQGFTQVLTNPEITLSNEEMQKISKMMQENSDRITRIVDKMLDFDPSREDQNYATPQ